MVAIGKLCKKVLTIWLMVWYNGSMQKITRKDKMKETTKDLLGAAMFGLVIGLIFFMGA